MKETGWPEEYMGLDGAGRLLRDVAFEILEKRDDLLEHFDRMDNEEQLGKAVWD